MGKIVNQVELSELLGKSSVTIWEWQEQGLPIKKEGAGRAGHEYDTADVVEWLIQRALTRAGKNKAALELELLELDVRDKRAKDALREKTLVSVQEIQPLWTGRVLAAAAFLSGSQSGLASILEVSPGIEKKREILRGVFAEFLTKLGVDGEAMHREVERLLGSMPAEEAAAFMRRIGADVTPLRAVEPGPVEIAP